MSAEIDFTIKSKDAVSQAFLKNGIATFKDAAAYIQHLPYGRNKNKNDLLTVFPDSCGTCSTKHALLKMLVDENGIEGVDLMLGMFKMNAANSPKVAKTLQQYNLEYIPEAHNYLRYEGRVFDYTLPLEKALKFEDELMEETTILPEQITDYKVNYHKSFLKQWLADNTQVLYTLDELWTIREQCISDLSIPSHKK